MYGLHEIIRMNKEATKRKARKTQKRVIRGIKNTSSRIRRIKP